MNKVISRRIADIRKSDKFHALSKKNQSRVIAAIKRGRIYLTDGTNGTVAIAGLHYTIDHTGKMKGLTSISTSVLANPICEARRKDNTSICAHCFAAAQMNIYKQMNPIFAENLKILKSRLLEEIEIPVILSKSGLIRGESFGDVCSVIQAANYLRIAAANPWHKVAIWTKNPQLYHAAIISGMAIKPDNLTIVLSSRRVNIQDRAIEKYSYFIDHVFTVYDPKGIKEQCVEVNCGALSCATCRKCYSRSTVYNIIEKLK